MTKEQISVLLIDDNDDDRALSRRAIASGFPHAVFTEIGTVSEFELQMERRFDCVITDYQLGWSNGLTVLQRLKERHPEQPVIMFTNTGTEDICAAGMRSGLSDYIVKRKEEFPKLPAAVRTALELAAARKELEERHAQIAELLERERAARNEAERASKLKDEFLAMLAHELRNPLAPISAAAELMGMLEFDPARLKQTSEVIQRQVRHLTQLVDDLLDVSRVHRGLATLRKNSQEMKGIVAYAVEQARPLMEARRHELLIDLGPEPVYVAGDESRLVQILTNLLQNAAKFTPEGGRIALRVEPRGDQVLISVEDNGIGMAPELQARVFDLFSQGERTPDRAQGGLGLGLALVKSLTLLHGGSVSCTSDGLGKGSRFTVCLPRLLTNSAGTGEESYSGLRASDSPLRVLVVDDNEDAARMLAMLLETLGHHVMVEHDPFRALERAKKEKPDACLLDIGLPGMDGHELATRLRQESGTATSRLIAITGYGQAQDRAATLAAGFDHHLVKPADMSQLAALLAEIRER
ncbi:MAG TPA: response regulator [Noviherbaspirillum sp.]